MNSKETFTERNIGLSTEFSRYLFEHPEVEEKIPRDAEVILLPEFDPELKSYNLELGKTLESQGGRVIYFSLAQLKSYPLSRIEDLILYDHKH